MTKYIVKLHFAIVVMEIVQYRKSPYWKGVYLYTFGNMLTCLPIFVYKNMYWTIVFCYIGAVPVLCLDQFGNTFYCGLPVHARLCWPWMRIFTLVIDGLYYCNLPVLDKFNSTPRSRLKHTSKIGLILTNKQICLNEIQINWNKLHFYMSYTICYALIILLWSFIHDNRLMH